MSLMVLESVRTAHIYAASCRKANRRIVFLLVLCGIFLSSCSCEDSASVPVQAPPQQPVSVTDINKLLNEGDVANHQLAAQIIRLSLPYGGQLNLELNLSDSKLSDEQLKSLTLPDSLTRVDLTRTNITDDGLAHLLTGKNIVELKLVDTRITPRGLVHLRAMPNLRTVNLHDTDIPAKEQQKLLGFLLNRPRN